MVQIYPRLKFCYYISGIIGVFGIMFLSEIKEINIIIRIVLGILYLLVIEFLFSSIARKRMNKLNKILSEECEVGKYIEELEILLKHLSKHPNNYTCKFLKIQLSTGYIHIGKNDEALKILESIKADFRNNIAELMLKIGYYNNFSVAYRKLNNMEKASEMLENMNNTIKETNKLSDLYKQNYMLLYQKQKMALDLKINPSEENYKKAEIIYFNSLERTNDNIEKVALHCFLAMIYEKLGKKEQQEKSMEYVLKNGGDTYMVQEIKNMKNYKE